MVSNKRAKKMMKRALEVGTKRAAKEFGIKEDSLRRYINKVKKEKVEITDEVWASTHEYYTEKVDKSPVLIIPDLHAPYQHPHAIEFLKWVYDTKGCGRVVSVGDLFDFHSMSRHVSEADADGAKKEYRKAKAFTSELASVFPHGDLVLGNHDLIPQRQMKEIGLIDELLQGENVMYNLPSTWNIHQLYHVIEPWDVLVEHGVGSGGKYGCANTAKEKRSSYVQGHVHSAAAVIYSQNHENMIFGMNVGCLVDSGALAFRYGKYGTRKGCLGCGVVYSGSHAEFVPLSSWENR